MRLGWDVIGNTKPNSTYLRIWGLFFPHSASHSLKIIKNSPHLRWGSRSSKSVENFTIPSHMKTYKFFN